MTLGGKPMADLIADLRCARRALLRRPGLTLAAILTLALGLGANTVIFAFIEGTLIRPLPYRDADRLVYLWDNASRGMVRSGPTFHEALETWRQVPLLERTETFTSWEFVLTGEFEPVKIPGAQVSPGIFSLLGIEPYLGHLFTDDDTSPSAPPVAVLGHGLWRSQFGASPDVLDQRLVVDGQPYTILGVLPPTARFIVPNQETQLWLNQFPETAYGVVPLSHALGRLRKDSSVDALRAAVQTMDSRTRPDEEGKPRISVESVWDQVKQYSNHLLLFQVAAGCVMLIACINVAHLLLAQGDGRSREMALRTILGASRWRLLRQLLTESLALSLLGGGLGLLMALWGCEALVALLPDSLSSLRKIEIRMPALVAAVGLSLVSGVLVGLLPALRGSAIRLGRALKPSAAPAGTSRKHQVFRNTLVVAEVAAAFTLLVGAAFLISSLVRLQATSLGFETKDLVTIGIQLPAERYSDADQQRIFAEELLRNVRETGLAANAALATGGPLDSFNVRFGRLEIEGRTLQPDEPSRIFPTSTASPGYFRTMGIPMIDGRGFLDQDHGEPVVILSQSVAKRYWPEKSPVGKQFRFEGASGYRIVGVAENVRSFGPRSSTDSLQIYFPFWQQPQSGMSLIFRSSKDRSILMSAMTGRIRDLEPGAILKAAPFEKRLTAHLGMDHFQTLLLTLFAGVGIVLTSIGVYSIVAYSVSRRTWEIGLRMALGAQSRDVIRQIFLRGSLSVVLGIGLGLGASLAVAEIFRAHVNELVEWEAATCGSALLLVATWGLVATWLPARQAARLEPTAALRQE